MTWYFRKLKSLCEQHLVGTDFELANIRHDDGSLPHTGCVSCLLLHRLFWGRDRHCASHLEGKVKTLE